MFVYGESVRSHLIGLVVLDEVYLKTECPERFQNLPVNELYKSAEFEDFMLQSLRSMGKDQDLFGFEQVIITIFI